MRERDQLPALERCQIPVGYGLAAYGRLLCAFSSELGLGLVKAAEYEDNDLRSDNPSDEFRVKAINIKTFSLQCEKVRACRNR